LAIEFIDTGFHPGRFNMDFDMDLVDRCKAESKTFVRFYGWIPYAISVGYHQARSGLEKYLDLKKCDDDGIEVVVRPTGGRAVLHAEELTYSVTIKTLDSAAKVYSDISCALVAGLRTIDESLRKISAVKDDVTLPPLGRQNICFASSVKNEINYMGRKLVGSAQRKFGDVVLQHGSILIGDYHKNIVKYTLQSNGSSRIMNERTTCLSEIIGRDVSYDEVREGVKRGFEDFRLQIAD
jgi:lipoate-protein ligase A